MNGYVEAGYLIGLGTLGAYGVSLAWRERSARRRLGAAPAPVRGNGEDAGRPAQR